MSEREIGIYAFLAADRVISEDNGKKGLIGVFDMFNFPGFPAQAPPWYVFLSLDNVTGHNEFTINFAHQESQQVIFSGGGAFDITGPKPMANIPMPIPPLVFQRPGAYVLVFVLNGREAASRIIQVNLASIER